jgi:membrane-bound lytic murein transglycosylase D
MKLKPTIWIILVASGLSLAGCEATATRQAKVRPPAATPAPESSYVQQQLPLPELLPYSSPLARDPRPAIDILVAKVQASYDAGQKEYETGADDKAQSDFDHAVNLILASGFQVDFDPRLSKLFDQLGEAVQSGELSALETSQEQEAETPADAAPIDEIADMKLPAGDPGLALKAEMELISVRHDLPLTVNDSVLQYLSFFTTARGREIVERGLERAGRYSAMIRRVLKEEGVPQDLIYLAQAESAFKPQAVSRAGARGIWQFMPFRGEEYDLERSYWVDERSDPEKATRAAAQHLRDLYGMFGDWYLVMAAYNSGPMSVARAIERTGYADFWELQKRHALPRQTRNYVPIIIALELVAKDPALYGVHVDPEKPAQVETVKVDHPISLPLAADAAGVDTENLRLLNPQLLRDITPNEPGFELKLPASTTKSFEENIQQVPQEKWTSWRLHATGEGETLAEIARRYHVTVRALEAANHLEPHADLPAGFLLNVPTPPEPWLVRYRIRRGDTLSGIAARFHVTVAQLKRWNHISGHHIRAGRQLRIYTGRRLAEVSRSRTRSARNRRVANGSSTTLAHRVKDGETLYSIARKYQTTISALRRSNSFLADRDLQAGDVLTIDR